MRKKVNGKPWTQIGNEFHQMDSRMALVDELPKAVYTAKYDDRTGEVYLERIDDKFTFNTKIYGLEDKFIAHVLKTYENTDRNLGVLLNGSKGTGKTVCAKIIANEMNLPVILCDIPVTELTTFIAQFNIPAIFFFDEFEKNFKDNTEILLSAMDGAYNTDTRKIFLITTNNLYINDNFISRPSRIRYKKTFGNLSEKVVREYCADNLHDKSRTDEIVSFIDTLSLSTIDILKTLVEEVNMHECPIEDFKHFFNVSTAPYQYSAITVEATNLYTVDEFKSDCELYIKNDEDEKLERTTASRGYVSDTKISSSISADLLREGDSFYHGTVVKPMDKDGVLVLSNNYGYGKPYIFVKVLNMEARPSLYTPISLAF